MRNWLNIIIIVLTLMILFEGSILLFGIDRDLYTLEKCHMVSSTVDGTQYCVQNSTPESIQFSSNMLSELNLRILTFLRNLKKNYLVMPPKIINVRGIELNTYDVTKNILQRYNQDNLVEAVGRSDSTSFTIDKGSITGICIKNMDGTYVDINTLVFVMLHEIAHLAVDTIQHDDDFWAAFTFLLSQANGIYTYIDYSKYPVNYCGLLINSTPLKITGAQ